MEKPGRSSRTRRQPARISLISLNVFGDDKKLLDVSPIKRNNLDLFIVTCKKKTHLTFHFQLAAYNYKKTKWH